jgi:hypothetical protein
MRQADDPEQLDTSDHRLEEVVEHMVRAVRARLP